MCLAYAGQGQTTERSGGPQFLVIEIVTLRERADRTLVIANYKTWCSDDVVGCTYALPDVCMVFFEVSQMLVYSIGTYSNMEACMYMRISMYSTRPFSGVGRVSGWRGVFCFFSSCRTVFGVV